MVTIAQPGAVIAGASLDGAIRPLGHHLAHGDVYLK